MISWVVGILCLLFLAYCVPVMSEAWQRINEYENMRSKGYTLMKNNDGDDFWVGYGD